MSGRLVVMDKGVTRVARREIDMQVIDIQVMGFPC